MSVRQERRTIAVTASRTIGMAYGHAPGTVFTNRGAVGTVALTLPTPNSAVMGHFYDFKCRADFSIRFTAPSVNTMVAPSDIAADSVGYEVSGKKIGRGLRVFCDGTQWYGYPLGFNDGFCIDGTEVGETGDVFTTPTINTGTLNTPIIVAPSGPSSTGLLITKSARFVEAAAGTSYTATVAVPAGAVIHDIKVVAEVLWNGTSATGKVGDTVDDDGFFTGINLKATDLLVGEVLSVMHSTMWGGKEGAYLVAATGQRGPQTTNFGMYYAAGSNIKMIVTPGAADGTLGRTVFSVTYSVGEALSPVVV